MVTDQQNRRAFISVARRKVARRLIRQAGTAPSVRFFAFMMWLAAASADPQARTAQAAPFDLQITQVARLAAAGPQANAEVEIRWTARVPRSTTIDAFDVLMEVRYSNGERASVRGDALKATARSVTLQVAAHPKANRTATLKEFHVSLRARVRTIASLTVVQQVAPNGSGTRRAGTSSAGQPAVFIIEARLTPDCAAGRQCIDVRWEANAPRSITIEGFTVSAEADARDGAHQTDSKTAGATERQARLAIARGAEIASLKVTLVASFSALDSQTVVRDGSF